MAHIWLSSGNFLRLIGHLSGNVNMFDFEFLGNTIELVINWQLKDKTIFLNNLYSKSFWTVQLLKKLNN